jgi:hypothetical protein
MDKELVSYKGPLLRNYAQHKQAFNKALNEICNNVVGNTLFRLLLIKMNGSRKIHLVNYNEDGSRFSNRDFAVKVNLSFYNYEGVGIPSRQYYCLNQDGTVSTKLKSLVGSIFHEFCHALHYVSGATADDTEDGSIWNNKEELRTITGHMFEKPYDPICDHVFDYSLNGEQFCPRYGHIGWETGYDKNPPVLATNLINQRQYLCGWKKYQLPDPILFTKPSSMSRKIQCSMSRHKLLGSIPALRREPTIIKPHPRKDPPKFK